MKLFPQFFAFLFFISIQFKVQHVNSTAKVGIFLLLYKKNGVFLKIYRQSFIIYHFILYLCTRFFRVMAN